MTHPLVGVWQVEVDDGVRSRVTHSYREDGTVVVASAFHAAQGVWRATGERTADVVVVRPIEAADRTFIGWQTATGNVEVSDDGGRFELSSTISRPLPDGGEEVRQATMRGTRLTLG